MLTLWDLVEPVVTPVVRTLRGMQRQREQAAAPAPPRYPADMVRAQVTSALDGPAARIRRRNLAPTPASALRPDPQLKSQVSSLTPRLTSAQDRYDRVVDQMLARYQVKVRRWRKAMSGVAWEWRYRDGSRRRMIEAPRPRGPMSAAIFLHEIGHHAIGFDRYKPRCLEEYHAWMWALEAMREHGLNITDAVMHRVRESLWYAVRKAQRRGIRAIPPELEAFTVRPPRRRRRQQLEVAKWRSGKVAE